MSRRNPKRVSIREECFWYVLKILGKSGENVSRILGVNYNHAKV